MEQNAIVEMLLDQVGDMLDGLWGGFWIQRNLDGSLPLELKRSFDCAFLRCVQRHSRLVYHCRRAGVDFCSLNFFTCLNIICKVFAFWLQSDRSNKGSEGYSHYNQH